MTKGNFQVLGVALLVCIAEFLPISRSAASAEERQEELAGEPVGQEGTLEDFPGISTPRVLIAASGDDWKRGSCESLAFTQDGDSVVSSFRRLPGSRMRFLLGTRVGEVHISELGVTEGRSRLVTTGPNMAFEILTTPLGTCRKPLTLAQWDRKDPTEIGLLQIAAEEEPKPTVLYRFEIDSEKGKHLHAGPSMAAAMTAPGKTLVLGRGWTEYAEDSRSLKDLRWRGTVDVWDIQTGKGRLVDTWETNQILAVACSADGGFVAAGGGHAAPAPFNPNRYDGRVVCWDADFEKKRFDLALPRHQVTCLVFSPDGKTLVTGGLDGAVKWIDVATGQVAKSLRVASRSGKSLGRIQCLAFSPNGKLLAAGVGSWNRGNKWGETFLIDVPKGKVYKVAPSQEEHVITCAAFSPCGKHLATAGMEGVVKLWRIPE